MSDLHHRIQRLEEKLSQVMTVVEWLAIEKLLFGEPHPYLGDGDYCEICSEREDHERHKGY